MNQHKAAKATNIYPKKGFYDSFSISRLLSVLNWKPLEERRTQARLCMVYMIINNLVISRGKLLSQSHCSFGAKSFESRESPLVTGIYVARGLRRLV